MVDSNVGKLARWLRLLGNDAVFFEGKKDSEMIAIALREERIILTRDTHIPKWGVVASAKVKAMLLASDNPSEQIVQVVRELGLDTRRDAFTVCLECNEPLWALDKAAVKDRVPPYVYETQEQFLECRKCRRVYWRGTHWQSMRRRLDGISVDRG